MTQVMELSARDKKKSLRIIKILFKRLFKLLFCHCAILVMVEKNHSIFLENKKSKNKRNRPLGGQLLVSLYKRSLADTQTDRLTDTTSYRF